MNSRRRNRSRCVRRRRGTMRRKRRTMLGSRVIASGSAMGRRAAMISGQRMLVSFHGSQDIARVLVGSLQLRGGKLGRNGGHPIEQRAEQQLRVEPRERGVVSPVGQPVEAAELLPALELKLNLPAQSVRSQTSLPVEPTAGERVAHLTG